MPDIPLMNFVHIQTSRNRSIRVEEDALEDAIIHGYVLTSQAQATLERIFSGIANNATRAWTLTGPYGSGKSYFGLFLSQVLNGNSSSSKARQKLFRFSPELAKRISAWANGTHGLFSIPITGTRISLSTCLKRGFNKALSRLDQNTAEIFVDELEAIPETDSYAFLEWVKRFTSQISSPKGEYAGVLVIIDELGKLLDYAAHHPQESDIFILQELAEFANRSGQKPFVLVGILHQAFEHYANFLDGVTYREWAKVQGRFEDIPYLEPVVQQMCLLSRLFPSRELPADLTDRISKMVDRAIMAGWKPEVMAGEEFFHLCLSVYPLHPTTFTVLPLVFRRLGQNERSIFTYLTSNEPNGFTEFLATHSLGEFLQLPHLFDYLATNYGVHLYVSGRAHPLIETMDRLASAEELSPTEVDLLKTIGVLNWLSENSALMASEASILSALAETPEHESVLRAVLEKLRQKSLISYRSFNQSFVVWQGSDVDIEARLQVALNTQDANFSIAHVLYELLPQHPVAARKHSYKTGTLRFFDVRYVDMQNWESESLLAPHRYASGVVLLCLPSTPNEIDLFVKWAQQPSIAEKENLVIGVSNQSIRIKQWVRELRGLYWVKENTPELTGDRVAYRELRTRIGLLEKLIRNQIEQAFKTPQISALEGCRWFYQGKEVSNLVKHGLSSLLSEICDRLYPASPRIWNELLNRRELTSQGAAARRNLIESILTRAEQPLLGIQKFPPERSMYEALLYRGQMHRQTGETWSLGPPSDDDPLNLRPTWQAMDEFVFGGLPEPRPLNDLYARLFAPPYGVTAGLAPVLLAVFYKVHQNEMTLYKEGTLLVEPDISDWEVLLRRPDLFSLAGCRVTGIHGAIVERMARGLNVPPFVMPVARALITRLKALPEHSWRTQRLPARALALRRAVDLARSPERFLFQELPEALEMPPFTGSNFDSQAFKEFFGRLNQALDALSNATPRLLEWARDTWLAASGFPAGEEGWDAFRQQAQKFAARVTHPQLIPLVKRAAETPDARTALESMLAQVANRPPRTWTDVDSERFAVRAKYLAELWRSEIGEIDLQHMLDPETKARAYALADDLQNSLLQRGESPQTLRAALQLLLERLKE